MSYAGLLADACTVVRRTPGGFNTTTGGYDAATDTAIYSGACRVAPLQGASFSSRVVIGDEAVIQRGQWVFLPLEATGPEVEDIVVMTEAGDANLIGRELVVRDVAADQSPLSSVAARWLICEETLEGS